MTKKYVVATLLLIFVVIISTVGSIISYNDNLNILDVRILNLDNSISIEEEEIVLIQERLHELLIEYTDYEKETNKMVVENLNPLLVLNMYPELKSNTMYGNLNRQYLKSMRNIKESKNNYNTAVERYNSLLVTLRGRVLSGNRKLIEYKK